MDGAEPGSRCVAGPGSSRPTGGADLLPIYVKKNLDIGRPGPTVVSDGVIGMCFSCYGNFHGVLDFLQIFSIFSIGFFPWDIQLFDPRSWSR